MTTELVTAHAGKNHVGSEDVGALYAGALGSGRFAFDVGEGLAVTMTDANTVRIGTGVFLMDGRQVRVKEAESVKVANGSQGAFRRDLVTYTYKRDPSNGNVEEGAWSVLQGTAASKKDEAKAPDYTAGNILDGDLTATVAVAEVSLSGLTPTARLLLPSVASLRTLGDSVSKCTRLWYRNYNTDVEPSAVTFTAPGGLDSYDYLVFFGKTSEYKRASATLSRDSGFGNQFFQLAAPYAPTGGTDIYERMTGYKVAYSGESVTVSPQWYNEVHFSANGCAVSTGKGVPLYEVVGVRRLR